MKVLVVIALVALGILFAVQHRTTADPSPAAAAPGARPVSQHDWAKQALDTTAKVRNDVTKQRAEPTP